MRSGYRPAVNPLHSVQRKLEWADKHIVDLGHELAGFRVAKAKAVIRENDPNRPGYSRWILTDASIPDPITLILGDAIHNLSDVSTSAVVFLGPDLAQSQVRQERVRSHGGD